MLLNNYVVYIKFHVRFHVKCYVVFQHTQIKKNNCWVQVTHFLFINKYSILSSKNVYFGQYHFHINVSAMIRVVIMLTSPFVYKDCLKLNLRVEFPKC